jgi:hypothetical protein
LNELLKGHGGKKRSKGSKKKAKTPVKWVWGGAQQKAFEFINEKLVSPPILGYADYSMPFILHTDASTHDLGSVLLQDGKEHA